MLSPEPRTPRYDRGNYIKRIWSVQMRNLDVRTAESDFEHILKGSLTPDRDSDGEAVAHLL